MEETCQNCKLLLNINQCPENKITRLFWEIKFKRVNQHKFDALTQREEEILRLIALDTSNRQISCKLHIAEHTVKNHRKNIYNKLDINSIIGVVKYAQAFDLI